MVNSHQVRRTGIMVEEVAMKKSIIIYDSECKLCNTAVRFLDPGKTATLFNFVPASDPSADPLIKSHDLDPGIKEKTVIYIQNDRIYTKSTAIIRALQSKGGLSRLAGVLFIFPRFIRDMVYDFIAGNRNKTKKL